MLRSHAPRAADVVLGGALAGVVFGAAGGSELSRTTIVEVLAVLGGGAVVAAAVVWGRPGRVHGATSVALFAALAVLTALSVTWAVVPDLAYVETGRTFAYLAVFAAAVAGARLAPRATPKVITGIVLAATAAVVYALAARVWPASIGENEISNRIGQPFQYWNAVGTTAALAIPGLLWLGTRREGALGRVLAYPALGAAILAILLTQSRGALVAAALGAIVWLVIVPRRLTTLPLIVLPSIGAGAVASLGAVQGRVLERGRAAAREGGRGRGVRAAAGADGAWAGGGRRGRERRADARLPPLHLRRRIGIVALAIACAVPLAAFTSVAFSDHGIGGAIGDRVDELTSETETAPAEQGAARFTAASSTRGKYWREAGRVFEDRPAIGLGRGQLPGHAAAPPLRRERDPPRARLRPQTLADLGIAGVVLAAALLLAWLVAVARVTGLHPRRLPFQNDNGGVLPRRDWSSDRVALVAAALIAVVFGLQSAIDWTWFVPGPTAMALVAAGFVAGRAPLGLPEPAPARAAPSPERLLAASGVLLAAILVAWAIWQPEAADRATGDAIRLAEAGEVDAALAKTEDAADANPLSSDPLLTAAAIETEAGQIGAARRSLEQAVLKFPGDSPDLVPPGRLPARHARPARQGRRHGAGSDLPRSALGAEPGAVPAGASPLPRAGRPPPRLAAHLRQQGATAAPQRADLEPQLVQGAPQRARGEAPQVRRERIGGPDQRSAGRGGQRELAAGHEDSPDLRQEQLEVTHVLDGLDAEHELEAAVVERKRCIGLQLDRPRARQARARPLQRHPRHVRRGQLGGVELGGEAPVAAAEVERALDVPEPVHEVDQVRRRRPRFGRHELPQLVVVAAGHVRILAVPPWNGPCAPPHQPTPSGSPRT